MPDSPPLFHQFDSTLVVEQQSFGQLSLFDDAHESFVEVFVQFHPGRFWYHPRDRVYFAPSLYGGRLAVFERRNGAWEEKRSLEGRRTGRVFEVVRRPYPLSAVSISGRTSAAATVASESLGLFGTGNEHLIHFSSQHREGIRTYHVEVFNESGALIGASELGEMRSQDGVHPTAPIQILGSDGGKRLLPS
jgi:hypothetical protein